MRGHTECGSRNRINMKLIWEDSTFFFAFLIKAEKVPVGKQAGSTKLG